MAFALRLPLPMSERGDPSLDKPQSLDRATDSAARSTRRWVSLNDPEVRETYLETLAETGNKAEAARVAGCSRRNVLYKCESDEEFAKAVEDALARYQARVHAEIRRRAIDGVEEPVFHQGRIVGHVLKYSDSLLAMEAKRVMPEYREATGGGRTTVNVNATAVAQAQGQAPGHLAGIDPARLTRDQREAFRAFLATLGPSEAAILDVPTNEPHELVSASPRDDSASPAVTPRPAESPAGEPPGDD